jgi:hypothetical protein
MVYVDSMNTNYKINRKSGSTFALGISYHRISMPARGILQEESQNHGTQDSANGDAARRGTVEQRGSRRGGRARAMARTRTGAGAGASSSGRGGRNIGSRGLAGLGAARASGAGNGHALHGRNSDNGGAAGSGGLLRRRDADGRFRGNGSRGGRSGGYGDAGKSWESAIASLLTSAGPEQRAAAGGVVRVDPALVGASAGDDLAVGSGRAADIERADASRAAEGARRLAGGLTLLERRDQAGQSGGGEEDEGCKLVHLDGLL